MIPSISIVNYKNLDGLNIKSFERVNLIVGKNNTGKSSLLEAIALFVSQFDIEILYKILYDRGEKITGQDIVNKSVANMNILSSLFRDRVVDFKNGTKISLSEGTDIAGCSFRFVQYVEPNSAGTGRQIVPNDSDAESKLGFEIVSKSGSYIYSLESNRFLTRGNFYGKDKYEKLQFLKIRDIERQQNAELWDKITLTSKEEVVYQTLRIIQPDLERITFVGSNPHRYPLIKLADKEQILPLLSLGDGINRILTIVLAMVNAESGYVLIDEFESGLHHSVQTKLWEMIFNISEKLNIQVFATTHSDDCVAGFETVLNNRLQNSGILIRLETKNGTVKAVDYSNAELKSAIENNIETR